MPCRDYYDDHPEQYYAEKAADLKKQVSFAESALCAALKIIENSYGQARMYDLIDYPDAGITRQELIAWHTEHKRLDALHRAQEQADLERKLAAQRVVDLKESALAKLTPEERVAILGVVK